MIEPIAIGPFVIGVAPWTLREETVRPELKLIF